MKTIYLGSGFTVVEILIVIVLIGILGVVTFPNYVRFSEQKKLDQAASSLLDQFSLTSARAKAAEGANPTHCSDYHGYELRIVPSTGIRTQYICCNATCDGPQSVVKDQFALTSSAVSIIAPTTNTTIRFARLSAYPSVRPTITIKNTVINMCIDVTINDLGSGQTSPMVGC